MTDACLLTLDTHFNIWEDFATFFFFWTIYIVFFYKNIAA